MTSVDGATQSQRSQELRKFFAPSTGTHAPDSGFNAYIEDDGALLSFAETAAWRLGAKRVMISLIDGETQYFLAGAELDGKKMGGRVDWFGCSNIPIRESLCQHTIAGDDSTSEYPCLVIEDLLEDDRFCHLPVVNGTVAAYRFYAGTSIATSRGVKIGSFFLLDINPRLEGLNLEQRKVICTSAASVMKHLEMQREAAERRRVSLMSHGIARFLEGKSRKYDEGRNDQERNAGASADAEHILHEKGPAQAYSGGSDRTSFTQTEDPAKRTFESAASILRESLEIESGGVVFLDTAVSFDEPGYTDAYSDPNTSVGRKMEPADGKDDLPVFRHNRERSQGAPSSSNTDPYNRPIRSSENRNRAAEIMAVSMSTERQPTQPVEKVLDSKTLQTLLNVYPEGNVWYFDDGGYFSSLEQDEQSEMGNTSGTSKVKRRMSEEIAEATLLRERFEKARQIIFLPMWDAATKRWYAGCLVWSNSAVPVFTVASEIAYLAAFTNSVTVEISRLDAVRADQAKADFISSISHEFRSPLHGILASAEFLRELTIDETQSELVSTVQNCGRTLLETINHVLDFSKINSFEKSRSSSRHGVPLPNELYSVTNIAVLCEEVVDGMIVANSFDHISNSGGSTTGHRSMSQALKDSKKLVEVVLDFEKQDWRFLTQPGALRRIIMNIFGNAQKYTEKGFIQISLRAEDPDQARSRGVKGMSYGKSAVSLIIKDSGRGISNEYLQHRLYAPFAQDDTFASGVGLGLSIVWSIVQQLGGVIAVRSLQGKGTEVEICLPVEKPDHPHGNHIPESGLENSQDAEGILQALRTAGSKSTIALQRPPSLRGHPLDGQDMILGLVEKYVSDWYGFTVSTFTDWGTIPEADVLLALEADEPSTASALPRSGNQYIPTLLLNGTLTSKGRKGYPAGMEIGHVPRPVGPYKLAQHLLSTIQSQTITGITNPAIPPPLAGNGNDNQSTEEESTDLPVTLDLQQPAAKESKADLGQTFDSIVVQNADAFSASKEADQKPKSMGGLRVLAVDDNEINLQLLQRFLSKRKDDIVDSARDGFEAVAAVQKATKPYDVVFMDISMPGMDGFEATRKIRQYENDRAADEKEEMRKDTRSYIVALTGLGASRDREEATKCGFDEYMTKPIPFQKVGKLLKERSSKRAE